MTPLPTFLRDACLAALGMAVVGFVVGQGPVVAIGGVVGVTNFTLMWLTVAISGRRTLRPFILAKLMVGACLCGFALSVLPAAPFLVGFCAPLLGIAGRGVLGLLPPSLAPERG